MPKLMTMCLIHQNNRLLLGMKKRGFGAGRWNGFGGKVHEGETIEQAVRRELKEEAGIAPVDLRPRGILHFTIAESGDDLEVHLFSASAFTGEPVESEEMKPQRFNIDDIPYGEMWPDDIYWFPLFLAGKNFRGEFNFKDTNTLLNYSLHEIDN